MALHYRGVTYDKAPETLETSETDVIGHYRGATWKIRRAKQIPENYASHARLKYRGAWVR